MSYTVDNAIIMAACLSSRLGSLTFEKPKALLRIKVEILTERLMEQLRAALINEIVVVVGYKKDPLNYLELYTITEDSSRS